jgi:hypothetical protein
VTCCLQSSDLDSSHLLLLPCPLQLGSIHCSAKFNIGADLVFVTFPIHHACITVICPISLGPLHILADLPPSCTQICLCVHYWKILGCYQPNPSTVYVFAFKPSRILPFTIPCFAFLRVLFCPFFTAVALAVLHLLSH